ncbi:c-type cytochrome [uncultured Rhodospira sp.]|uniref:c-type cytochrome n=1 Tax=uncultured Rhodospira sp. TaxID=1936189 RepID=UPI00260E139D|nr:c-type cytochrome [uncultured Rhodospira sp.]
MLRTLIAATGIALTMGVGATAASAADVENGEKWANRVCKACHTFDEGGKHMVGPNLWGIVGKTPGTIEGYDYEARNPNGSAAIHFADNGIESWTEEKLAEYIANVTAFQDEYGNGNRSAMVVSLPPNAAPDVAAYLGTLK